MDTHDRKVIDILGDNKRFIVPFYQRHYKWDEKLWQSFWEDVQSKAEEAIDTTPKFAHYMGALILSPESVTVAVTPRLLIVDGQQRITTFQLFLAALREVAKELGYSDIDDSVKDYLFNTPKSGDRGDDVKFKLTPNRADREIFYRLIRDGIDKVRDIDRVRTEGSKWFFMNGRVKKRFVPNAVRAMIFFKDRIHQFVVAGYTEEFDYGEESESLNLDNDEDQNLKRKRLESLLTALLRYLKLVVITLDEDDDAQVIFETLNSKSEPLTAMELVRNFIFQRAAADSDAAEELFEDRWRLLEDHFWNETAPRARPRRPRIDHYLGHTLTAHTGVETSLKELYAEYRGFSRPKGKFKFESVEGELDALLLFVPVYHGLEGKTKDDPDLLWLGNKLALWEITTAYPVAFVVAVADTDQIVKRRIYELINSYLVRRAICGLTPKNLNKNFQRIVSKLLEQGVSLESFLSTFDGQNGESVRFPSDAEFREAILKNPIYQKIHRKERIQDILWDLECSMRDRYTINTPKPNQVSVEHILPQNWYPHWRLPNGKNITALDSIPGTPGYNRHDAQTQEFIRTRENLIHSLGNLTLISIPGNTIASYSAFHEKTKWLKKSLLAMNMDITTNYNEWNEETIQKRGEFLADYALNIWPAPKDSL